MSDNMSDYGRELDWDDVIENDGDEFQILPEGDYDFTVTKFERGRSKGSAKIPPCNMAIITMRVSNENGSTVISDNIVLHTKMEWKISQFFRAIGQKKHGEQLQPRWGSVVGSSGRCHVYVDKFQGNDGRERESNKIDRYYDPDPDAQSTTPAANTAPSAEKSKRYWK